MRLLIFGQGQGFHTNLRTFSVKTELNSSYCCYLFFLGLEKHVKGDLLHLQGVEMDPSFLLSFLIFSTPTTQSLIFLEQRLKIVGMAAHCTDL